MKKLLPLLSCLLLFGCGEKKGVGDNGQTDTGSSIEKPATPNESEAPSEDGATVDLASTEVEDLPLLPEIVTKEFIMDLWAKPHDGRDMIDEFADGQIREGVWKVISTGGPRRGEITGTIESTMTLKMLDRRYQVWEWREGESLSYVVATYDYDASCYRWWGTSAEETLIFEQSGRRYWRNLIEWKALTHPDPELESTMRTTFVSEDGKRFKVTGKAKRNGEVVRYSKSEFTWYSELPEEHRSREDK